MLSGQRQLAALLSAALPAVLAGRDPIGTAMARLFARAPVAEVMPSLLALAERLEARPCPVTPSIPPPPSWSPQPVSGATVAAT